MGGKIKETLPHILFRMEKINQRVKGLVERIL